MSKVFGFDRLTGHGEVGGGWTWWLPGGGRSDGSSAGVSKRSSSPGLSFRPRNGKLQAGSLPGFWTLLGIHLRGWSARISQPTCATATTIASTTRKRYPFRLRYRNLNKNIVPSSPRKHVIMQEL